MEINHKDQYVEKETYGAVLSAGNIRVLLAEDDPINQKVVCRILMKGGYAVDVVENGEEVLEALKMERFDILLMNVQMPKMDGIEATRLIRRSKNTGINPEIPIIALTSHEFKEDVCLCMKLGMNSCVTKPFKSQELFKEIERFVLAGTVHQEIE